MKNILKKNVEKRKLSWEFEEIVPRPKKNSKQKFDGKKEFETRL